jgi:hypothetical protein
MCVNRKTLWLGGTALALTLAATAGVALAGYANGDDYTRASPSYQLGYAAGVADTLAALQGGSLLKDGAFNDQTGKIARCLADKKVKQSQIRAAYLAYLQANPGKKSEAAGPNVFEALKKACGA